MDEYRVTWLEQRIGILEGREQDLLKRIVNLEQQVANQAFALNKKADKYEQYDVYKSQAAAAQATEHLYAPLREEAPSMRGDVAAIFAMKAFIERFLAMDDLGLQVSSKTRDDAREALGRARVES
jgi:hypothetical protein